MEFGHVLTVLFHLGTASDPALLSYQECWELGDWILQEKDYIEAPEPGSYFVGVSCTETQTIIAAPPPMLRPEGE